MHEFDPRQRAAADFLGGELRDAAGELRTVQIADPDNVTGVLARATRGWADTVAV